MNLIDALHKIRPAGPDGFEGLIAKLLSTLTGQRFRLARSGSQRGRDMNSREVAANVIAVECKRYGERNELDERELMGEILQLKLDLQDADIWALVTSRSIDPLLHENLRRGTEQLDMEFVSIAIGDGEPSSLEALCALAPDITMSYLARYLPSEELDSLNQSLTAIAQLPEFRTACDKLSQQFLSPQVGYANWRAKQNSWFRSHLQSHDASLAAFKQLLNVDESTTKFVERQGLYAALDHWLVEWNTRRLPFVILGEEGDGKSWGVASWLNRKIATDPLFPPILFIASLKASSNDARQLIVSTSAMQTDILVTDHWRRRLHRWLADSTAAMPALILVLDGINERYPFTWWLELLVSLKAECVNVAIIMTCRTEYWQRTPLGNSDRIKTTGLVLPSFSRAELQQALDLNQVQLSDIHINLRELIRKPRYFDLTVKYLDRLEQSGDPTPARLIYEDWRDRLTRKLNADIAITDEAFRNILRELADKYYSGGKIIKTTGMNAILGHYPERQLLLDELRSSGVLSGGDGGYKVVDRQLAFGFGLLLFDELRERFEAEPETDLLEAAARWLEPRAGMALKALICEMAALHALEIGDVDIQIKVTLLELWLNSQNPSDETEGTLTDYLPLDPKCYIEFAEHTWSEGERNYWAQELLKHAFIHWCKRSSNIASILTRAFDRWLTFVHPLGYPTQRRGTSDRSEEVRAAICARLGRELKPGRFSFAGREFTAIDNDGLLDLGDMALAAISHLPVESFIPQLATACLAEAIMGRTEKYDLFQWLFSTTEQSVWPAVYHQVQQLLAFKSTTTDKAAYRLLTFEGSSQAYALRQTLPPDLFPPNPIMQEYAKDPCASGFTWSRSICEDCLRREDLDIHFIARQLKSHCVDPTLQVPPDLGVRLASLTQTITIDEVWTTMAAGVAEHDLETFEPALCAYAPDALAELVCTIVRQAHQRQGMALRQLGFRLREHSLIFEQAEYQSIYQAWQSLIQSPVPWSEEQEAAEMCLFELVLSTLDAQAQIQHQLQRPEAASDLIRYSNYFLPIENWPTVELLWLATTSVHNVCRILWFLAAHPEAVPDEFLKQQVVALLEHDNSLVRATALRLIVRSENTAVASSIALFWTWHPDNHEEENHWGSLLLCKYGQSLTITELFARVHPVYFGQAVQGRGCAADEVNHYAEQIHTVLYHLQSSQGLDLLQDFPPLSIYVEGEQDPKTRTRNLIGLSDRHREQATFWPSNKRSSQQAQFDLSRSISEQIDEKEAQDRQVVAQALQQQTEQANYWFGRHFDTNALTEVISQRPDLLEQWLNALTVDDHHTARLLYLAHSFYESLCIILLQHAPERGLALYTQLNNNPIFAVDSRSHARLVDQALFGMIPCAEASSQWLATLNACKTDLELLTITSLAQRGTAGEWLWTIIDQNCDSASPREQSLAITALAFYEGEQAVQRLTILAKHAPETWRGELIQTSLKRWQRNHWAKHWFRQFFNTDRAIDAWAAFRLFLSCVDRRFWHWQKQIRTEYIEHPAFQRRNLFVESNRETIRNKIRQNEEPLKRQLYGQKLLEKQVWPWI
jgi:hypothetical protein